MRGHSAWSYAPYCPPLWESGDIYICRLAPAERSIRVEWLGGEHRYELYCRKRDEGAFVCVGQTADTFFDIPVPNTDTDYEFYVQAGEKKSRIRLARAGKVEGTVVNYLHPDDAAYSFSGGRLASPSLVRLPDGALLASMDVYAKGAPQNLTLIFRSEDEGQSWQYLSELYPCFWGKMFVHKNELYMLGCSTEYGDLLIGKSTDGGKHFGTPSVIARGTGGKNGSVGFHRAPQNILEHGGRLYTSYEWGSWANGEYCHAAGVLSCDTDADLLTPENWYLSEPRRFDPAWLPEMEDVTPTTATIEGTVVEDPQGNLLDVMRFECAGAKVLLYRADPTDAQAPLTFARTMDFPAGHSKFIIRHDGCRYYSVATRYFEGGERTARGRAPRNLLSLLVSNDLVSWRVAQDLIDYRDHDINKYGFQYVDFDFDGEDIIFLCRTAMNGAADFHDSNYITFHRAESYKNL